jgi:hypothetical protein
MRLIKKTINNENLEFRYKHISELEVPGYRPAPAGWPEAGLAPSHFGALAYALQAFPVFKLVETRRLCEIARSAAGREDQSLDAALIGRGAMNQTMTVTCIQCGRDFEFSASEQIEFAAKGFDPPKRCPDCRRKKGKSVDTRFQRDKKKHYRMKYGT